MKLKYKVLCGTCRKNDEKTYATKIAIILHTEPSGWGNYTQFAYVCDPHLQACLDSLDPEQDEITINELTTEEES